MKDFLQLIKEIPSYLHVLSPTVFQYEIRTGQDIRNINEMTPIDDCLINKMSDELKEAYWIVERKSI